MFLSDTCWLLKLIFCKTWDLCGKRVSNFNRFLLGFADTQGTPATREGSQAQEQDVEAVAPDEDEPDETEEGAVGSDPLELSATQELEDDDDGDDGEDDDDDNEYENEYNAEEEEYLNKFIKFINKTRR